MKKYIDYVNKFQEANEFWFYFIENQLKKHLVDNEENQTEIEEILDFVYSTKKYYKNKIKAKIWSWITLAEYNNEWFCTCVKSSQIDWVILKEDTFYILKNGEFIEFKE